MQTVMAEGMHECGQRVWRVHTLTHRAAALAALS